MQIEFYWNETRTTLICEDLEDGMIEKFENLNSELVNQIDLAVLLQKPSIHKALCESVGSGPQHAFDRVYQFAACNFSTHDGRADLDADFNITSERVPCPMRHRCQQQFCFDNSSLSAREIEIVKLFARSNNENQIGEKLFISPATVHNHIQNIYHKLGFTGSPSPDRRLIAYAFEHKLT